MTDIPARIEDLITTAVGEFELVAEHSWPGPDRPQIWEVRGSDGQRWFIKRHAGPKGHRREVAACVRVVTDLVRTLRRRFPGGR